MRSCLCGAMDEKRINFDNLFDSDGDLSDLEESGDEWVAGEHNKESSGKCWLWLTSCPLITFACVPCR